MTIPAGLLNERIRVRRPTGELDKFGKATLSDGFPRSANIRPVSDQSDSGVVVSMTGEIDITVRDDSETRAIKAGDVIEILEARNRAYTVRDVFRRKQDRLVDIRGKSSG